eukprot:UN11237
MAIISLTRFGSDTRLSKWTTFLIDKIDLRYHVDMGNVRLGLKRLPKEFFLNYIYFF